MSRTKLHVWKICHSKPPIYPTYSSRFGSRKHSGNPAQLSMENSKATLSSERNMIENHLFSTMDHRQMSTVSEDLKTVLRQTRNGGVNRKMSLGSKPPEFTHKVFRLLGTEKIYECKLAESTSSSHSLIHYVSH